MTADARPVPAFAGHEAALARLRAALASGCLAHAYVFSGPAHVGKGTLARLIARSLLCETRPPPELAPCGRCSPCVRVLRDTHPDVKTFGLERQARESDRAVASRELGIDTVRELVGAIDLLPYEAPRTISIVEDAETLSDEAANALLKTLEEPPAHATLLLIATDPERLPETIRSRCVTVRLQPVAGAAIRALLTREAPELPTERGERIAALAGGRPGWALRAARDPSVLETVDANVAALLDALRGGAAAKLALAERLAKRWTAGHRAEVYALLGDWLGFCRAAMLASATADAASGYPAQREELLRLAGGDPARPARVAARVAEAIGHLDANVNTRMTVETLLLDLPS